MSSARPARTGSRLVAAFAGVLVLLFGMVITLGAALLAVGGLLVVHALQRRRGRQLTPLTSWAAAVGSVTVLLAVVLAVLLGSQSDTMRDEMRAASDVPPAEPPAWLQRMAPTTPEQRQATEARTDRMLESDAFLYVLLVVTTLMGAVMGGLVAGTLGWLGAALLGYAALGRRPWHRSPAPAAPPDDEWATA